MKYIRHYNKVPKTVKWRYFDPTRHITSSSAVTVHLEPVIIPTSSPELWRIKRNRLLGSIAPDPIPLVRKDPNPHGPSIL
jgi:hypothetical protein